MNFIAIKLLRSPRYFFPSIYIYVVLGHTKSYDCYEAHSLLFLSLRNYNNILHFQRLINSTDRALSAAFSTSSFRPFSLKNYDN